MKTALRLVLSLFFLVNIVLTIHLFAWKALMDNTDKVKETLRDGNVYSYLAAQLTKALQNQSEDGDVSLSISGPQLAAIADPLVEQSILYVTGKSTDQPAFSFDNAITQFMGQDPKLAQELKTMQAEMVKEMRASKDEESIELAKTMESIPSSVVFDTQLAPIKKLYEVMRYLPYVFLGMSGILFVLIILLVNSHKQRISWIAGVSLFTALVLGIGIAFISVIPSVFTVYSTGTMQKATELLEIVIPRVITPVLETVRQYHVVGVIVSVVVGLIAVCARFMLFSKPVQSQSPVKKK